MPQSVLKTQNPFRSRGCPERAFRRGFGCFLRISQKIFEKKQPNTFLRGYIYARGDHL